MPSQYETLKIEVSTEKWGEGVSQRAVEVRLGGTFLWPLDVRYSEEKLAVRMGSFDEREALLHRQRYDAWLAVGALHCEGLAR
jgi:hypothetical protein